MAEPEQEAERAPRGVERRGSDRRAGDRRGQERRTPPPPWRSPLALVSYGVLGALALVLAWNLATGGKAPPVEEEPVVMSTDTSVQVDERPATTARAGDAFGVEGFERLVVEGDSAVGRRVRTEIFCGNPTNYAIIQGHTVPRSVAELIQEGKVPAAECKWGQRSVQGRPDFLLLIPPALADDFSSAPVVSDNYVDRRRLVAEVEWVGRSETLALRTGGVFRGRTGR